MNPGSRPVIFGTDPPPSLIWAGGKGGGPRAAYRLLLGGGGLCRGGILTKYFVLCWSIFALRLRLGGPGVGFEIRVRRTGHAPGSKRRITARSNRAFGASLVALLLPRPLGPLFFEWTLTCDGFAGGMLG